MLADAKHAPVGLQRCPEYLSVFVGLGFGVCGFWFLIFEFRFVNFCWWIGLRFRVLDLGCGCGGGGVPVRLLCCICRPALTPTPLLSLVDRVHADTRRTAACVNNKPQTPNPKP